MRSFKTQKSITPREGRAQMIFFNEISRGKQYKNLEIAEAVAKFQETGCLKAKDLVYKASLKFVVSVAKHYHNKRKMVELSDLIQEGSTGIEEALKRFDVTTGYTFLSYAVWWIRQKCLAYVGRAGGVSFPVSASSFRGRVNKFKETYYKENNILPTDKEIRDGLGTSMTNVEVNNLKHPQSMSLEISEGVYLGGTIADYSFSPSAKFDNNELKDELRLQISKLSKRQQIVINNYFGIGCAKKTLEEVGELAGITRERVRQIKVKALKMLKVLINQD